MITTPSAPGHPHRPEENSKTLSKTDLIRIEAEDLLVSRVFDDDTDDAPADNGNGSDTED